VELKCGVKTLSDVHTTGLALLTGEKCVNILPYDGWAWRRVGDEVPQKLKQNA